MCGHRHWLTNSNKLVIPFKLIHWARKVIQVPRQELTHIVPPLKNRRTFLCFLFNTHWRAIHLSSAAVFLHEYLLTSAQSEQCPRAKQKGLRTSQVDALICESVSTRCLMLSPNMPWPSCPGPWVPSMGQVRSSSMGLCVTREAKQGPVLKRD